MPSYDDILRFNEALEAQEHLKKWHKFQLFKPYEPQLEFFRQTASHRDTLFLAGTQTGKTESGSFAATCHLTGLYPQWWPGKRFNRPTRGWAGGEGTESVRDVMQRKLCGMPGVAEDFGSGMIPRALLIDKTLSHGVSDAFDTIMVRHVSGGVSTLGFKSYVQGRLKWQGDTLDWVWEDEEPPSEIHGEALARLKGDGILFVTCTPLQGVTRFIRDYWPTPTHATRGVARMGLRDVKHFTDAEKEERLAGYQAHQRTARMNGDPVIETGQIYPVAEENIRIADFPLVDPWVRGLNWLWCVDFGVSETHPFAAVLCAWDKDADVFYVARTLRLTGAIPITQAAAIKAVARNVPVAWPHDGTQTQKGDGDELVEAYRKQDLNMLKSHATHSTGGYGVELGLQEIFNAMTKGKFKVFASCHEFWDEFRAYRRDENGKIVKKADDVMDAVRGAWMMRRYAKIVPLGGHRIDKRAGRNNRIDGADDEHFGL